MYLCFDIETAGDKELALKSGFLSNIEAPSNYKDPIKIASYIENKRQTQLEKLALKPNFAMIKLITIYNGNNNSVVQFENENCSRADEKNAIEEAVRYVQKNQIGTSTSELVTFNGKRFDFPVLLMRGEIVGANIPYRWVQTLMRYGDRGGHYDIMDDREGSLNLNLRLRFGKSKKEINFETTSFSKLKAYAVDEIKLIAKWYCLIMGYDFPEEK